MTLRIIDPTGRQPDEAAPENPAPRLQRLDNANLGLLLNEHGSAMVTNWPAISSALQRQLEQRHSVRFVAREFKPRMSEPATADLLARFARGSDGVINGLGK